MTATPEEIERAYIDNRNVNQIGSIRDGITSGVAEDLGYSSWEEAKQLADSLVEPEPLHEVTQLALSSQGIEDPAPRRPLTSKEKNANEATHRRRHNRIVPKQIRGHF